MDHSTQVPLTPSSSHSQAQLILQRSTVGVTHSLTSNSPEGLGYLEALRVHIHTQAHTYTDTHSNSHLQILVCIHLQGPHYPQAHSVFFGGNTLQSGGDLKAQ